MWLAGHDKRALKVTTLNDIFHDTREKRENIKAWRNCSGPAQAAQLELNRLGWSWPGPLKFVDDLDREIDLCHTSPARLKDKIRKSRKRSMLKKLAQDESQPLDTTAIEHVIQDKKTTNREAAVIQQAFTRSVWTRTDLIKEGYEIDSALCPLCQEAPDTLKHRIWNCNHPRVQEERKVQQESIEGSG